MLVVSVPITSAPFTEPSSTKSNLPAVSETRTQPSVIRSDPESTTLSILSVVQPATAPAFQRSSTPGPSRTRLYFTTVRPSLISTTRSARRGGFRPTRKESSTPSISPSNTLPSRHQGPGLPLVRNRVGLTSRKPTVSPVSIRRQETTTARTLIEPMRPRVVPSTSVLKTTTARPSTTLPPIVSTEAVVRVLSERRQTVVLTTTETVSSSSVGISFMTTQPPTTLAPSTTEMERALREVDIRRYSCESSGAIRVCYSNLDRCCIVMGRDIGVRDSLLVMDVGDIKAVLSRTEVRFTQSLCPENFEILAVPTIFQ